MVKYPPANTGDAGSIPGLRRSLGVGNGTPLQYSYLENIGQGSLMGYSPRGHEGSDMTEPLSTQAHLSLVFLICRAGIPTSTIRVFPMENT